VDTDQTAHPGTSLRYFSVDHLKVFTRMTFDAMGVRTGMVGVGLMITAGAGMGMTFSQFEGAGIPSLTPFVLNSINPARMLIGTKGIDPSPMGNIYESLDNGDTLTNLGTAGAPVGDTGSTGSLPMAYGGRLNGTAFPDVFYVGAGNTIIHRVTVGSALATLAYPGGVVRGIVMDPQNYKRVFVLDNANKVFGSADEGATWADLTGNLGTLTNDAVRVIELVNRDPGFQGAILYVGGFGNVWQLPNPTAAGGTWTAAAAGLPKVIVYELHYDYTDSVLAAATFGRGVFRNGAGPATPGSAANISTRLPVGTGDNILITGFIITGPTGSNKRVLVRGIGPSTMVPGALADPTLELRGTGALLASNDNWRTTVIGGIIPADQVAEIQATTAAPTNDAESALIGTLAPGLYTAQIRGANNTTGIGLSEAFDLSPTSVARLANVSTRGFVQTGDNLMIGGFIIVTNPVRVVIRGIGPSLTAAGVPNALADPTIELRGVNGLILANNNWRDTQQAEIMATTLQPTNDLESALVMTLQPGLYTAQLRGNNNGTGNGLVEIFALPTLP
jgi:hypothetical protein